ncbi:MAG: hypothetical protein HYV03_03120 [Deltaproteobacteria bacterium]|nr:hypothetical protein [Deltaproteobacteria bacterium]
MGRRYRGRLDLLHSAGLTRFHNDPGQGGVAPIGYGVGGGGGGYSAGLGSTGISAPLMPMGGAGGTTISLDATTSPGKGDALVDQLAEDSKFARNWNIGAGIFNGVMGLWGGILQTVLLAKQISLSQDAMELEKRYVNHKIDLENMIVTKQSELATKKLDTEVELAGLERSRQTDLAKIKKEAAAETAKWNAMQSPFKEPFYGKPAKSKAAYV